MCGGNGWMWHGGYGGGWGWAGWLATAVVMVAFFALVITGIVVAVRYLTGGNHRPTQHPGGDRQPEHLLAERFACG